MYRDLEREGRVVRDAGRVGRREQQRVPVLVLQALAVQRGAAGGGAEQEAAAQLVGERHIWSPVRWKPNIE